MIFSCTSIQITSSVLVRAILNLSWRARWCLIGGPRALHLGEAGPWHRTKIGGHAVFYELGGLK
jgi:hypothetical protein